MNLPSPGADELDPAPAMVVWRRRRCGLRWWRRSFPSLSALDLNRVGVFGGEPGNAVNLVLRAAGPHLFM